MRLEETTCLLCGNPAQCATVDEGNRTYCECSNPRCGNYEVSRAAQKEIEGRDSMREELSEKAVQCKRSGEILRVAVGSDGNLMAACAAHPRQ